MKQVCHLLLVLGVTLLLPPGVARAQSHIPTYLPDFMPAGIVVNNMLRNQDRMAERRRGTPSAARRAPRSWRAGRSSAAAQIAATYPQGDRAQLPNALEVAGPQVSIQRKLLPWIVNWSRSSRGPKMFL